MRFKICSNSHIDVVVYEGIDAVPRRVTSFYGQLDAGKRPISWQLIDTLKAQCEMPWVVFGDFNKITHLEEKLGGADREVRPMEMFRDCLNSCELHDLGFVGQSFTWCNGRFGDQSTV